MVGTFSNKKVDFIQTLSSNMEKKSFGGKCEEKVK